MSKPPKTTFLLRIRLDGETAMGPGKADLLEGISETGSIAAAGRRMKMSYKRAWMLVESMNACFSTPLVETQRGGKSRGGAKLTEAGEIVLATYRRMMATTADAIASDVDALRAMLATPPDVPDD